MTTEEVTEDTVFHNKLIEFNEKINEMVKQMKELQAYGKVLDKEFNGVSRQLMKLKKTKNKSSSRPLSGFAVPSRLTDELYEFLKIQKGTLIARKDVTKMMNEYIVKMNAEMKKIRETLFLMKNYKHCFIVDLTNKLHILIFRVT